MLDEAYERRNSYAVELALRHPKWGLAKIARETNIVFGEKYVSMNWRHVSAAMEAAGIEKINGRWQKVTK